MALYEDKYEMPINRGDISPYIIVESNLQSNYAVETDLYLKPVNIRKPSPIYDEIKELQEYKKQEVVKQCSVKQSEVEDKSLQCFCAKGKVELLSISICMSIVLGMLIFFVVFYKDVFTKLPDEQKSTTVSQFVTKFKSTDVTAIYENNTAGAFNQTQQIAAAKELQIIRLYNVYPNVSFKNNSGCFAVTHIRRCKEKCEAYEKLGIECNSFEVKPPRSNLVKTMNCCLHKSYVFRKDVIKSRYEDTTTYELIDYPGYTHMPDKMCLDFYMIQFTKDMADLAEVGYLADCAEMCKQHPDCSCFSFINGVNYSCKLHRNKCLAVKEEGKCDIFVKEHL